MTRKPQIPWNFLRVPMILDYQERFYKFFYEKFFKHSKNFFKNNSNKTKYFIKSWNPVHIFLYIVI